MAKYVYRVTAPDGTVFTRESDRTYTHASLGLNSEGKWQVFSFNSRPELAQYEVNNRRGLVHWQTGEIAWTDFRVLPVTVTERPAPTRKGAPGAAAKAAATRTVKRWERDVAWHEARLAQETPGTDAYGHRFDTLAQCRRLLAEAKARRAALD